MGSDIRLDRQACDPVAGTSVRPSPVVHAAVLEG